MIGAVRGPETVGVMGSRGAVVKVVVMRVVAVARPSSVGSILPLDQCQIQPATMDKNGPARSRLPNVPPIIRFCNSALTPLVLRPLMAQMVCSWRFSKELSCIERELISRVELDEAIFATVYRGGRFSVLDASWGRRRSTGSCFPRGDQKTLGTW